MSRDELIKKIRQIIADELEVEVVEITNERKMESLDLDSLSISSIIADVEDLDIEIDSDVMYDLNLDCTVGMFIDKILNSIV